MHHQMSGVIAQPNIWYQSVDVNNLFTKKWTEILNKTAVDVKISLTHIVVHGVLVVWLWESLAEGSVSEVTNSLPATVCAYGIHKGISKPRSLVKCTEGLYVHRYSVVDAVWQRMKQCQPRLSVTPFLDSVSLSPSCWVNCLCLSLHCGNRSMSTLNETLPDKYLACSTQTLQARHRERTPWNHHASERRFAIIGRRFKQAHHKSSLNRLIIPTSFYWHYCETSAG